MPPVTGVVGNETALTPAQILQLMLLAPALTAPAGADTIMTLDGPGQVWYLVTAICCIAVPGMFLIARIYTKVRIVKMIDIADYLIFLAYPLIVVLVVIGYYMVKWGGGVHQWQITVEQLFKFLYWGNAGEIAYAPAIFLVKTAILVQYLRLFAPSRNLNKAMFYGAWATIICSFIFYIISMFWTMFYCKPRRMIWDKLTPGGKCRDHNQIIFSQGTYSVVSDVVILLLPISSLWKLRVPLARKVHISALFATGLLACGAASMRIFFTVKISAKIFTADVSYYGLYIGLWSAAEVALGLIVACALSLPKLVQAKRKSISRAMSFMVSPFSTLRSATSTLHSRSRSRGQSMSKINGDNSQRSAKSDPRPVMSQSPGQKILHDGIVVSEKLCADKNLDSDLATKPSLSLYTESSYSRATDSRTLGSIDEEREREIVVLGDFDFELERDAGRLETRRESMMISPRSPLS